jgi:two-component system, chemotaxis family, CheB/CheR fusion protein
VDPVNESLQRSSDPAWEEDVRVLLVEDDEDSADATRRLLVRYGARVDVASSAADAMERFAGVRPELVITDLRLPDLDGFCLIARLRGPMAEALPMFVVLSGSAKPASDTESGAARIDQYFRKPIEPTTLRDLVVATRHRRMPVRRV